MTDFTITTGEPFVRTESGNITGVIFVTSNGRAFPEAGWRDFVTVVLGWWLDALRLLASDGHCTLDFMDGPYKVRVTQETENVRLTFLCRTLAGEVAEGEVVVSSVSFVREIVEAGSSTAGALRKGGYIAEADALMRAITR